MANTDARLRLRAALSHREKAKLSIQECAQALTNGSITKQRHDSLFEFYSGHLKSAEHELAAVRTEQRKLLESLQAKLTSALDSQFTISERASTGVLSATKANARNRQLTNDIAEYRSAITECASLIAANSAAELGGFLDLPLEHYARPSQDNPVPTNRLERGATYLIPIFLLFTAFLPWLKLGNVVSPLFDLANVLSAAGIVPTPAPEALRVIWLPFVLIPLLAYPVSLLRDKQNAGWGLTLTGFLAIAAVLAPVAALSANPGSPVSFIEFVAGLQFGAFSYLGGGVALTLLGARRLRRDTAPTGRKSRGGSLFAGAALLIVLAGAALLLTPTKPSGVLFEAHQPDPASGQVAFVCNNKSATPINLYVPWPEEGNRGMSGLQATYGVSLLVQAESSPEFRLLTLSQDFWVRSGASFPENRAFRIEPNQKLSLALDSRRVQDLGITVQRIRILVSQGDGRTAYVFDTDPLPSHYPPTAPRANATPPQNHPEAPSQTPAPADSPIQSATAPSTQEPTVDSATVRYLGIVGSKAALAVTRKAKESPQNVSVVVGDSVEGAWVLKEIVPQPASIVLLNERTGKTISIDRGDTAPLPRGR